MAFGDANIMDGAIWAGIIFGVGYLLVFPFWMIRKLGRIETRLKQMQKDMDEQDDILQSFDRRIEELDANLEEQRKEIIEAIRLTKHEG
ncbi:MAG: hypothetical protein QME64_03900 [bacterium]|nr:hypothetical protein [bacterium]